MTSTRKTSQFIELDDPRLHTLAADELSFLIELVRRNSGLQCPPLPVAQRQQDTTVRLRWKRWLRFGGAYDWRLLRKRMRSEGLRPSSLFQPKAVPELPAWIADVAALRSHARQLAGLSPAALASHLPGPAETWAFAELLVPGLLLAKERLAALMPEAMINQWLSSTALAALESSLLKRLAQVAGRTLVAAFDEVRPALPFLARLTDQSDLASKAAYNAFIQQQLADAFTGLGKQWPVLLRLLVQVANHWAEMLAEFLTRLNQDALEIEANFFHQEQLGPITHIKADLSDPHAGGRTVLILEFSGKRRLVYKPRTLDMEANWSRVLAWFNQAQLGPAHATPLIVARDGYGWMQWIEQAPMAAGQEPAFAWRLGSLLALVRCLYGVDIHSENLVAAGACPVIIDHECLLHQGYVPALELMQQDEQLRNSHWDGLLQTLMLPAYSPLEDEFYNIAAIAASARANEQPAFAFVHQGSDWLYYKRSFKTNAPHHQPYTTEGQVNSFDYAADIATGYEATLLRLLQGRDWLLEHPQSPLASLRQGRGRQLVRPTWQYAMLIDGALEPEALTDGVSFALSFEPLYREQHLLPAESLCLARAERAELHMLDVPRFGFIADKAAIYDAWWNPLDSLHKITPWHKMARAWRRLTQTDIQDEVQLIQRQLTPWQMLPLAMKDHAHHHSPQGEQAKEEHLKPLVNEICQHQYPPLWIGLCMGLEQGPARPEEGGFMGTGPLRPGLYSGTTGIALALAGAGKVTGNRLWQTQAAQLLREGNRLFFDGLSPKRPLSLGYDTGLAGILYTSHCCGQLCGDANLFTETLPQAISALKGWAPGKDARPGRFVDLLNGVAGLALVLGGLVPAIQQQAAAHSQFIQQTIEACADFLIQTARNEAKGICWAPAHEAGLCGLSHGNSGIALGLAAAWRLTGQRRYLEAVFAALEYENSHLVKAEGNWLDLRGLKPGETDQADHCGVSWCHGAPGIALSRAALLHLMPDALSQTQADYLKQDLELALATTQSLLASVKRPIDDICCGRAGLMDILLACSALLGRPRLRSIATDAARARTKGLHYWFSEPGLAGADPSLFKGIASELYLQARLQAPELMPSVLLPL